MTSDDIDRLLREQLDGSIDERGRAELAAAMRADAAVAARLAELEEADRLLAALHAGDDAGGFAAAVVAEVRADARRFAGRVVASARRQALAGRRRRRGRLVLALAAALLVAAVLGHLHGRRADELGRLADARDAAVLRDGRATGADGVFAGDRVQTGERGSATLRLRDGSRLALAGGVDLGLRSDAGMRVDLAAGAVRAEVRPQEPRAPLRVETPQAEATVVGTGFRIASDAAATVLDVDHGAVRFAARPGHVGIGALAPELAGAGAFSASIDEVALRREAEEIRAQGLVAPHVRGVGEPRPIDIESPRVVALADGSAPRLRRMPAGPVLSLAAGDEAHVRLPAGMASALVRVRLLADGGAYPTFNAWFRNTASGRVDIMPPRQATLGVASGLAVELVLAHRRWAHGLDWFEVLSRSGGKPAAHEIVCGRPDALVLRCREGDLAVAEITVQAIESP